MSVLSLSETKFLKNVVKNPEENYEKVISLIDKKLQECTTELEDSENKFQHFIEAIPDLSLLISNKGVYLEILGNEDLLYLPKEDLLGKSFIDILPQDVAKLCINAIKQSLKLKKLITVEYKLEINDKTIYFEGRVLPLYEDIAGFFVRNITERKIAEEQLIESEKMFRTLIDGLTQTEIGVDIVKLEHQVIYQNDFLKDKFGDHHGRKCYEHYLESKKICRNCPMERAIKYNRVEMERIYTPENKIFEITSAPLPNKEGIVDRAAEVIVDVTERVRKEQEIKESEEQFRMLAEQSLAGIGIVQNNKFIFINKAYEEFTGFSYKEIYSMTANELIDKMVIPEERERIKIYSSVSQAGDRKTFEPMEFQILSKDGKRKSFYGFSKSIEFQGDSAAMSMLIDITERKEAERKFRYAEMKFKQLFEQSPFNIAIYDKEGLLIQVNKAWEKLWEVPRDYAIGKYNPLKSKLSKEKNLLQYYERAYAGDSVIVPEFFFDASKETVAKGEGRARWIKSSIYPLKNFNGDVLNIVEFDEDITEQKKIRERFVSEKKFTENAINSQRDTFFVFDPSSGKAIRWNKAFKEVSGYSDEEIISMKAPDSYYSEEDLRRAAEATLKIESDAETTIIMDLITKEGKRVPFEYVGSSITDEDGKVKYIVSIGRNITERRIAEEKLKESEETFRTIFEFTPRGMFLYHLESDDRLVLSNANPAADDILGVDCQQFIGKTIEEAFPPLVDTDVPVMYKKLAKEGGSWNWDQIDYDHEQIRGAYEVTAFHIAPNKMVTSFTDITERIEAAKKLEESEEKFRTIIENAKEGYFESDLKGNITFFNTAFRTLLKYSEDELIGKCYKEIVVETSQEKIFKVFNEVYRTGKVVSSFEYILVNREGNFIYGLTSVNLRHNADGDIIGFSGFMRDITEKKKAEESLRRESEFNSTLIQASPAYYVAINAEGKTILMNEKMLKVLGYTLDEVIEENYLKKFVPERERALTLKFFNKITESFESTFNYNHILTKEGNELLVEWYGSPVFKSSGELDYFIGIGMDITERTKAEIKLKETLKEKDVLLEKLRKEQERYQSLMEFTDEGFYLFETQEPMKINLPIDRQISLIYDGVNVECNDAQARMHGYSKAEDFIGKTLADAHGGKNNPDNIAFIKAWIEADYRITGAISTEVDKDGNRRWFSNNVNGIIENGMLIRTWGTQIDITNQKLAEEKLKESEERYRILFDNSPIGIGLSTFEGKVLSMNNSMEKIVGYTIDEYRNINLRETYSDPNKRDLMIALLKDNGYLRDFEAKLKKKESHEYIALINIEVISLGGEDILHTNIRDITEFRNSQNQLRESEEKYRNIVNNIPGMVYQANPDWTAEIISNSEEISGYKSEELNTINWINIIHPDDKDSVFNEGNSMTKKPLKLSQVYRIITKEGKTRWVNDRKTSIFDDKGDFGGINGIVYNISDIKEAEENLIKSEEKYRSLFENSPIALMDQDHSEMKHYVDNLRALGVKDFNKYFEDNRSELIEVMKKTEVTEVNNKAIEIYKARNKEDFISIMIKLKEGIGSSMKEEVFSYNKMQILALINGEVEYESEVKTKTFTGENIYLFAKTSVISGFEDTWSNVIVSLLDITDEKIMEEELKESEEKYRNLVETSSMGLLEIDFSTKELIYINPRLIEIIGYNYEELIGIEEFHKLIHPEDLKEMDFTRTERRLDFRVVAKDGKTKWLSGNRIHVYTENGDIASVRLWLQDITEKEELEQIKTNLLMRFSHEFKTPLISIKGFSEFLLEEYRDKLSEKIVSFLEKIQQGADKLKSLTNTFLETSQLDEKLARIKMKQVNISNLIKGVIDELEGITRSRHHLIDLKIDKNLLIDCDPEKLHTIISNLILNASKFTPPNGLITVSAIEKKGTALISVKDNGIGLTKEEKENIFLPFGKIERFGQGLDIVPDGMGMGLYISKELVELHGGKIWAESTGRNKGFYLLCKNSLDQ